MLQIFSMKGKTMFVTPLLEQFLVLSSIICLETYFQGVPWDYPPLACLGADVLDSLLQRPLVNNRICCCYKGPPHFLLYMCSTSHIKIFSIQKGMESVLSSKEGGQAAVLVPGGAPEALNCDKGEVGEIFLCFCLLVYSM